MLSFLGAISCLTAGLIHPLFFCLHAPSDKNHGTISDECTDGLRSTFRVICPRKIGEKNLLVAVVSGHFKWKSCGLERHGFSVGG